MKRKEIDETYRNLLNKMLEENLYFGVFQNVDLPNNRMIKGTIRIELEISDLNHIV